jgi:hypothetical protein
MPKFSDAGQKRTLTGAPLCMPTPCMLTGWAMVCCFSIIFGVNEALSLVLFILMFLFILMILMIF